MGSAAARFQCLQYFRTASAQASGRWFYRRNYRLLQLDIIDQVVLPSINLLKDSGFSDGDIQRLYKAISYNLGSPDLVKKLIEETEALGFDRQSGMFVPGLIAVGRHNSDAIMSKFEFLRNKFRWSEEEVLTAFRKFPNIVSLSEKTLKTKHDFLLHVGFTNQNLISNPVMLGLSLEKRLLPRNHVLNILKLKGLDSGTSMKRVFSLSEQGFRDRFVMPYKIEVPELEEIYAAKKIP